MSKQVVFIASMSHSGSTLLDLLLGGHPRLVGIGEVFRLLQPDGYFLDRSSEEDCSCGKTLDECEFWAPLCARIRGNRDRSVPEKYRIVLEVFGEVFGGDRILVDSSKYLDPLRAIKNLPGLNLKVLHVIRDVRGWAVSHRGACQRYGEFTMSDLLKKHGPRAGIHYARRTWTGCFLRWYRGNLRMQRFLQQQGLAHFRFGYEELCLYADTLIPKICEFLGVEPVEGMYSPRQSNSHNALGNALRFQKDKRRAIFYDDRWTRETGWLLPATLLWPVTRYNAREVHRNTCGVLWEH